MKKAIAALAIFVSAIAVTTPFVASAQGTRFACDTPDGRLSELTLPVQARTFLLRGTIKPVLFRKNERWLPTARISLQSPETRNALAINIIAQSGEATEARVMVQSITDGDEKTSNVGTLALDNIVGFEIRYNQAGESAITIGEQTYTATTPLSDVFNLGLNCSTADFVFENIVWQVVE